MVDGKKIVYELWDEALCGGDQRKLVDEASSTSFAFDEKDRLVYFGPPAFGGALLMVTDGKSHEVFDPDCPFPLSQQIYIDVSADGQRWLVSLKANDSSETVVVKTRGAAGCGDVYTGLFGNPTASPLGDRTSYFSIPTRLDLAGDQSLHAVQPAGYCSESEPDYKTQNAMQVYSIATGTPTLVPIAPTIPCSAPQGSAWLPNGKGFVAAYRGQLYEFGVDATGASPPKLIAGLPPFTSVAWLDVSPDGKWLVVGVGLYKL